MTGDILAKANNIADLALRMGEVERATFHPDGVTPETDATHTLMLALLCFELAPLCGILPDQAAAVAIVHDLPEAFCGDTNTAFGLTAEQAAEKRAKERAAIDLIGGMGLYATSATIDLYEEQGAAVCRFVRLLDKVCPKLTHAANGCAGPRRLGMTLSDVVRSHEAQSQKLRAEYPEKTLIPIHDLFDRACKASEAAFQG